MKAKEKAQELFSKFYMKLFQVDSDVSEEILISILSKECALICMEEIIKDLMGIADLGENVDYWMEVKREIEKL